jgi:hypothetical protein
MTTVHPTSQNDEAGLNSSSGETRTASSGQGGGMCRMISFCRELFDSFTPPLGYEDETGFHYGNEPKSE